MDAGRRLLGTLSVGVMWLVGCGGSIEPDVAQRPTPQPVQAPKTGESDDANGAKGDANGGPTCSTLAISVSHACLPPALRSRVPLRIYAEDNGCYGSCEGATVVSSCQVKVEGHTISLGIESRGCSTVKPGDGQTCTSDCRALGVECELPALEAGTYRVRGERTTNAANPPLDRTLVIRDDERADTCVNTWGSELAKP